MNPLPIDPMLPSIVESLRQRPSLVLEAPPGAGKTTRVPPAILDAGLTGAKQIVVLQPRRLAARMAARRVAEERGDRVGGTIGYQVRFDEAIGPSTRVRFVTEGILTRRLLSDRTLAEVGAVLLDEFHERHLHGDVALALLKRLQKTSRPDLKIVVMSATLEAAPVAKYLDDAPSLKSEGRRFDVAVEFAQQPDNAPLSAQVASAVQRLVREGLDGDVLVFLPGAAEIHRAREACAALAERHELLVLPLYGDLSPAEQDRAVRPADRRKVILSTNVAETSLTIDGVVAVIDSGLARIASHAPWSGMPVLRVGRVSRASAIQRTGRAGRTRPGRCIRLYTRHDFDTRPDHESPEIKRLDLSETVLEMRASGIRDVDHFDWFDAPPPGAIAAATKLLVRLGALDREGAVTSIGTRMLRFPVHPRQARMILEGWERGITDEACTLAALVGERDTRSHTRAIRHARGTSDLLDVLEAFEHARADRFHPNALRDAGLDAGAVSAVERVRAQLNKIAQSMGTPPHATERDRDQAMLKTILAGYPDRVGRCREPATATGRRGHEIVFAQGGTAQLAESSVVRGAEFVVAVDAEERQEGRLGRVLVRIASAIEGDWLLEMFTDAVTDATTARWNATTERVEVVRRLAYDDLVLEEQAINGGDANEIARVLADAANARGFRSFVDAEELDRWMARVEFLRLRTPGEDVPAIDDSMLRHVVTEACAGARSFQDLRNAGLMDLLRARLGVAESRRLDEWCPDRVALPGGRRVRVEYPADAAPWIASRLQDFFGMRNGPTIAGGRVPLVLHLLAPNQRDVQVTTDLEGFWTRHYPTIAKELRRKYPRHQWPDDPQRASPPSAAGRGKA